MSLMKSDEIMKKIVLLYVVMLFCSCTAVLQAEKKSIKRIALVVGNQDYVDNALENPENDARGIARTLESIGFEVILRLNVTLRGLEKALSELQSKIEPNNTIVFLYFAGHGNTLAKVSSEEYLMMTDKKEVVLVSIFKLYDFLNNAKARYNIVVIDACRDYKEHYVPLDEDENMKKLKNFRGNFRTVSIRSSDGIKKKQPVVLDNNYSYKFPSSTIVSYATMPNQRAKDWSIHDEKHSPYAYALMKYLNDEEIPIEEVFRRVRTSLLKETGREQSNLEELNLEKNIWLVPKRANVAFTPAL